MSSGMNEGNRRRSLLARFVPLLIGLVCAAVFLIHGCEEGPFGRKRVVALDPGQEAQLGAQAFRQVLSESDVDRDPVVNEAVSRVVRNLIRGTGDRSFLARVQLEPQEYDWKWSVVRSREVNAFCLPGGKMVVYTGILPVAETEAGLAVVMGHEISHALARHGSERMAQQQALNMVQMGAAASFSDLDPASQQRILQIFNAGAKYGLLLPYSRDHESEADHMGLMLMAVSGYDPANAPRFWQRMTAASQGGRSPPEFASTHPGHERRIAQLEEWQAEARPLYEASQKVRNGDRPLPR